MTTKMQWYPRISNMILADHLGTTNTPLEDHYKTTLQPLKISALLHASLMPFLAALEALYLPLQCWWSPSRGWCWYWCWSRGWCWYWPKAWVFSAFVCPGNIDGARTCVWPWSSHNAAALARFMIEIVQMLPTNISRNFILRSFLLIPLGHKPRNTLFWSN